MKLGDGRNLRLGDAKGWVKDLLFSIMKAGDTPGTPGTPSITEPSTDSPSSFAAGEDGDVEGLLTVEDEEGPGFIRISSGSFWVVVRKNGVEIFRFSTTSSFNVTVVAGDNITFSVEGGQGSKKVTVATYLRPKPRPASSSSSSGGQTGGGSSSASSGSSSSSNVVPSSIDDGFVKWDSTTINTDRPFQKMVYGKGVYVGLRYDSTTSTMNLWSSTDGKSWRDIYRQTNVNMSMSWSNSPIAFGQGGPQGTGIFVVSGRVGTSAMYWMSTNGISWNRRPYLEPTYKGIENQIGDYALNIEYDSSSSKFISSDNSNQTGPNLGYILSRLQVDRPTSGNIVRYLVHELKNSNKKVKPQIFLNNAWYGLSYPMGAGPQPTLEKSSGTNALNTWTTVGQGKGPLLATNGTAIVAAGSGLWATYDEGQTWEGGYSNKTWTSLIYANGIFMANGHSNNHETIPAIYQPDPETGVPVMVAPSISYQRSYVAYSSDGIAWIEKDVTVVQGREVRYPVGRLYYLDGNILSSGSAINDGKYSAIVTTGTTTGLPSVIAKPGKPTNIAATAGDTNVFLSWNEPSSTGGSPVKYTVEYSSSNYGSWNLFSFNVTGTSVEVTGLTNGTAYRFRVASENSLKKGDFVELSQTVTPVFSDGPTPPSPTTVTINSQPTSFNFGFDCPPNSSVQEYTFSLNAIVTGSAVPLAYQWQYMNNQSQWVNFANETYAQGINTSSLKIKFKDRQLGGTANIGSGYRCVVSALGATPVTSNSAGFICVYV